jgi:hypothetical protein
MSGGWIAKGPPATGTCHTMVIYGVDFLTVPGVHGGAPVTSNVVDDPFAGPQTLVR